MEGSAEPRLQATTDQDEKRPSKRARHQDVHDEQYVPQHPAEEDTVGINTTTDRQDLGGSIAKAPASPFIILHRVACSRIKSPDEDHSNHPPLAIYRDEPRLFAKDTKASVLRGSSPVTDVDAFLSEGSDFSFVVYKHYSCRSYHDSKRRDFVCTAPESIDKATFEKLKPWFHVLLEDGNVASVASEEIMVRDQKLSRVFGNVVSQDNRLASCYLGQQSLRAPYDFFYHFSGRLTELLENQAELSADVVADIRILLSYIETTCRTAWHRASQLFHQRLVSAENFSKLFYAGEILVHDQGGLFHTYLIETLEEDNDGGFQILCWNLAFDGGFRRQYKNFVVNTPEDKVDVKSLVVWPLRLDRADLMERLQQRGAQFWQCRRKRLVGYQAPRTTNFELQVGNPKFMVDTDTHRTLHPNKYPEQKEQDYEAVDMSTEEPPKGDFSLLLPATIPGFGFHDKKWINLQVDHIRDVFWNEHAFTRLVLKGNKKELIQALVTVHLENNQATDVIEGKGAGLIMLLHGPPGTGKTLTAETVSELANKPLYRVTCGDIGIDAEGVEKYLESALYLGTLWDCVVLLDEADVFLEERTQTDLARNALVSVFLRVLEYFNGILILTSNRVGLFDEAFKSRMQLAIRYPPLDEAGRFKIWDNFFNALQKAGAEMEFDDLRSNVNSLARKDLNGRQIRNVIKTARQLAAFRKQKFGNQHLECAIEVVEEFEKYLVDTRGSDAYYARQQRLRYE